MAMKFTEYKRKLGKPMSFNEDWEYQSGDDIQRDDETDDEYKRRMRIKRNRELERQGKS